MFVFEGWKIKMGILVSFSSLFSSCCYPQCSEHGSLFWGSRPYYFILGERGRFRSRPHISFKSLQSLPLPYLTLCWCSKRNYSSTGERCGTDQSIVFLKFVFQFCIKTCITCYTYECEDLLVFFLAWALLEWFESGRMCGCLVLLLKITAIEYLNPESAVQFSPEEFNYVGIISGEQLHLPAVGNPSCTNNFLCSLKNMWVECRRQISPSICASIFCIFASICRISLRLYVLQGSWSSKHCLNIAGDLWWGHCSLFLYLSLSSLHPSPSLQIWAVTNCDRGTNCNSSFISPANNLTQKMEVLSRFSER